MKKNKKNLIYSILLLILLSIGIGYAYLTSNLSINGSTEISANSWDIHFANLVVNQDSVTATTPASINSIDDTSISYSILLSRPKDYYEFTVDMVNEGSIPGKISLVSINGITSAAEGLVDYLVVYSSNSEPVQVNDILNANSSKNIRVRVFYNDDITADDLPDTNIPLEITLNITFVQSDEEESNLSPFLLNLIEDNPTCMTKYEGQVTDSVGVTTTANNVYFNKCADKRNIIFNNMCWQMIRTTETGGMKLIYNGIPVNNKCESTRSNQPVIYDSSQMYTVELDSEYVYGNSFSYDISTGRFTLLDTFTESWSDSTYENLLGKYTCAGDYGTCVYMYQVVDYFASDGAYGMQYQISSGVYPIIGTSSFNYKRNSLAMVGYMFNKEYIVEEKTISSTTRFGSTFTYNNGTYTLSGTTQDISSFSSGNISNTHYTCWNTSGTCNKISYVYLRKSGRGYYIELSDGENIENALNNMLYSNNVNTKDSVIKKIIDAWYRQNLNSYTNMLEDTVYCNDRSISNLYGWDPNGGNDSFNLDFRYNSSYHGEFDLVCPNVTDQFSVGNTTAKLTYPVGLINITEAVALNESELISINEYIWGITPSGMANANPAILYIDDINNVAGSQNTFGYGIRPVISLKSNTVISSGIGSEENPWIVN